MGNRIPFDLNKSIQRWRDQISGSPAIRGKDMDELEDHLRDSIASLELRGLTAQEAFWIGIHRLGASDALKAEFGKVNRSQVWLDRALWMVLGSLAFGALNSITYSLSDIANFGVLLLTGRHGLGLVNLILPLLILGLLLLFTLRWANRSRVAFARLGERARAHPVITVVCIVAIFAVFMVVNRGTAILTFRNVPMEQYAEVMKWRLSASILTSLVSPVLLGWLLFRTRPQREAGQHC